HQGSTCPKCQSGVRQRLLLASFRYLPEFSSRIFLADKDILHFAPESEVSRYLSRLTRKYFTADLERSDVNINLDMTRMTSVVSESLDIVIACDVLEHVHDDKAAMPELYRVLRTGGTAILTVPQKDHAATTYEDQSITSPQEREKAFGQSDHLRIYGDNFPLILESVGFRVTVINELNFPDALVRRHVLAPPVLSTHPLATNYRKIFFAHKC